ncbi:hypothetical protein OH76DRAFT_360793 [Lentinus brumalis]|uniref:Uncharacterized protein n=1 Tax=Lentinus brumalis TaxID=2498619 RepID=A0A371CJ73_9APHY|nr:hypothetical protein OH76DRAFT_360793 [Polyporus brumalis]
MAVLENLDRLTITMHLSQLTLVAAGPASGFWLRVQLIKPPAPGQSPECFTAWFVQLPIMLPLCRLSDFVPAAAPRRPSRLHGDHGRSSARPSVLLRLSSYSTFTADPRSPAGRTLSCISAMPAAVAGPGTTRSRSRTACTWVGSRPARSLLCLALPDNRDTMLLPRGLVRPHSQTHTPCGSPRSARSSAHAHASVARSAVWPSSLCTATAGTLEHCGRGGHSVVRLVRVAPCGTGLAGTGTGPGVSPARSGRGVAPWDWGEIERYWALWDGDRPRERSTVCRTMRQLYPPSQPVHPPNLHPAARLPSSPSF